MIKYFMPVGRMRRRDYLIARIVLWPLSYLPLVIASSSDNPDVFDYVLFCTLCMLVWSEIVLYGKRLHDADMSAWWMLSLFVPFMNIGIYLAAFMMPGTEGANRFGPDTIAKRKPKDHGKVQEEKPPQDLMKMIERLEAEHRLAQQSPTNRER